jgi:predicted glycosyltransferase
MRILIDIGHPAHVHLFKNFIREMEKKGHQVLVTAREKDVATQLLKAYNIPFIPVGKKGTGTLNLIKEWIFRDIEIIRIARKFNPDILMGVLNPATAHAARILGKVSITFTDSEPEVAKYPVADTITLPFTDVILTLASVRHDYGKKEVRVNSFKELASLHPARFTPDPEVLNVAGLSPEDDYALVRFVAWGAYHDVGQGGLTLDDKRALIRELEQSCRVYISSESPLPPEFEKYRLPIPPEKIHDFLHYAKIFVSDSQTMTTEAALLGTPAVRCNSFVGKNDMGNFVELEERYHLIYNCGDGPAVLSRVNELLQSPDLKAEWARRREPLLQGKIDLTAFMVWFVENYPRSFTEMKEHPEAQYSCASVPGDAS